ncbi:hypothetical protein C7S15_2397 [Burkholderia cepacia]|nr:hypothetical protein [Burkholderia cepacia]
MGSAHAVKGGRGSTAKHGIRARGEGRTRIDREAWDPRKR